MRAKADPSQAERPFRRLLLQSKQRVISAWIRAVPMEVEEGIDVRDCRKTESTIA